MEITTEYEDEYCLRTGSFNGYEKAIDWNGRSVKTVDGKANSILNRFVNMETKPPLTMSKPDCADVSFRGGVERDRGPYIEGRVDISWDFKPSSDSKKSDSPPEKERAPDNKDSPGK